MALSTEEIIIDLQLNADPSTKSLSQLEQELVNLKDALRNVEVGSDDFKKLQAEVIKADSRVKNLNKSIEGLDTEALAGEIGKLGGGITSTFTGVAAAIGSTSGEFEEFTKKIVTGIAVAEGIKGATEAWTAAQKLLNFMMAANPIGAVIAAVAALAAGIYLLVDAIGDTSEEQRELNKVQAEYNAVVLESESRINSLEIEILKLKGTTEELIEVQIKQINNEYDKAIAAVVKEYGNLQPLLEEQKKLTEDLTALQIEYNNANKEDYDTLAKIRTRRMELNAAIDDNIEKQEEELEAAGKNSKNRETLVAAFNKKIIGAEIEKNKRIELLTLQTNKDKLDKEKEINKKLIEERKKFLEKLVALEEKFKSDLRNVNNELISFEKEYALQLIKINKDIYDKELALLAEANKQELDSRIRLRDEKIEEKNKELAEVLKLNEQELNNEKKLTSAVNKLNQEERVIFEKLIQEKAKINATFLETELALITINDTKILELQLQRQKSYIEGIKSLENENERSSINLIKNIRERNLKIIALEARLAGDTIIEEVKKNEKLIAEGKKRLELLQEELFLAGASRAGISKEIRLLKELGNAEQELIDKYEEGAKILDNDIVTLQKEREIINENLQKLDTTNNKLAEKLRLVGETAAQAKEEAKANTASLQALVTITERRKRLVEGQWARERDLTVESLALQTQLQLDALKVQYEQGLIVAEEYEMAKKDIEDEFRKEKIKADIAGYKKAMDMGKQLFSDFQAIQLNLTTDRINKELRAREAALEQEVRALDGAVEAGIMSEDAKKDALNKIDFERQKAQRKAAYDQAKAEKEQALVKIAIDTATAIVEAAPVIPLQIQAAILGASQAAVIQSQPLPQLKRGGRIKGPSHENGGVPLYKNGKAIAEVEGDELIMTKGVAQSPVLLNMASTLNQLAGGISLDNKILNPNTQSVSTMPQPQVNIAAIVEETVRGITSIPVTNVSTETDRVARKVRNIEARSKF